MSYDLTDDQRSFQDTARRFAREKLAAGYQRREAEGCIDRALVREMGSLRIDCPGTAGRAGRPWRAELTAV